MKQLIRLAPVRKRIHVQATQRHAFEVFTRYGWWPKEHSILVGTRQAKVIIEPHVGGRWFERGEDGSECNWGEVRVWEPPARIVLVWRLNGRFQYDANLDTEVEIRFRADGGATIVELEHRHFESAGETAEALRSGVDSPDGWAGGLTRFKQEAERQDRQEVSRS